MTNVYKHLMGKNLTIIEKACDKWSEKIENRISPFSMRKSFSKNTMIEDIYLRYIQFRTLHRRFYTNNILFKCKLKPTSLCEMCNLEMDSNEHMLINCTISQQLWSEVEFWLSEIGLKDYKIDEQKIILGETEKSYWINMVLLITKKVIFNAKIAGKIPNIFSVKCNLKTTYTNELLKSKLIQKEYIFEKRWGIFIDYIEEQ